MIFPSCWGSISFVTRTGSRGAVAGVGASGEHGLMSWELASGTGAFSTGGGMRPLSSPGKIPDEPAGSSPRIPRPISCATGFHRGSPQGRARQMSGSWRCPASVVQSQLRRHDPGNKQPELGLSPELITGGNCPGIPRPMCAGVGWVTKFPMPRPDVCLGGIHHRGPLRANGGKG